MQENEFYITAQTNGAPSWRESPRAMTSRSDIISDIICFEKSVSVCSSKDEPMILDFDEF